MKIKTLLKLVMGSIALFPLGYLHAQIADEIIEQTRSRLDPVFGIFGANSEAARLLATGYLLTTLSENRTVTASDVEMAAAIYGANIPEGNTSSLAEFFNREISTFTAEDYQSLWNLSGLDNLIPLDDQLTQQIMSFSDSDELYIFLLTNLLGLGSLASDVSTSSPVSPSSSVISSTMRTTLFTPAQTAQQRAVEERATVRDGIAGLPTRIGMDAFYGRSNLDGGGSIKSYGVNLSAIVGDQLQFRGTIPIHRTDVGFAKITSYGIDGSVKYNVNENFAVGGHSNYIYHDISGGGNSHNWTVGPFASANFDLNESFNVSFGTMLDYVRPKSGGSEWVVAGGVNLGWSVSPDFVLNPYLIYFRNLDVDFGDKDWWDLGIESSWAIGETWTLSVGAKTTLGYDPFRSNWQIYLGTAWAF